MTLNEFIEDAFNTELEYLMDALGDITPEELMWRAGPEANPIGWILWHMIRVEDMWFQFFIQRQPEIWEKDAWNEKFGLQPGTTALTIPKSRWRTFQCTTSLRCWSTGRLLGRLH